MENKKRIWLWLVPAVVVFAAGFLVAARYDLPLDIALYNPGNPLAIFMEGIGWLPAFLPTLLLALLVAAGGWQARPRQAVPVLFGGVLAVLIVALVFRQADHYFQNRGITQGLAGWQSWVLLGLLLALTALWMVWVLRQKPALRAKLRFFALAGSAYMMANQLVINGLKLLWQRTRFDDLLAAGSFDHFTPWFQLPGFGGSSLPSGHTANAAGIFMLVVLCDLFPAWNRRRRWVYGLCWGYIALMALCRMVIGRHYLSDTLAAAGVLALLFWALRATPLYKKGLLQARAGHPRPGNGEEDAI